MKIRTIFTATCAALAITIAAVVSAPDGQAETPAPQSRQPVSDANDGVSGIRIPDSQMARDAAKLVRDTEGDFLFQHSTRVYYWAALAGKRKGLSFDPELLYVAAIFHDFGLTAGYGESHSRFEVDGANAARDFLRNHGISGFCRKLGSYWSILASSR